MENITYCQDGLTENIIIEAVKAACAQGFICTLPETYDMELSGKYAMLYNSQFA